MRPVLTNLHPRKIVFLRDPARPPSSPTLVIPAKAGIQGGAALLSHWIPAFTAMAKRKLGSAIDGETRPR
jgi:hypothetical protein